MFIHFSPAKDFCLLLLNEVFGISVLRNMFVNKGQGGDATRSYFQGQRPNPKLVLEKGSNSDPRSQSHGKNMESRFVDSPLPQNFECLEQKFIDDIIKLAKEQNDAEDEENARHREVIFVFLFH